MMWQILDGSTCIALIVLPLQVGEVKDLTPKQDGGVIKKLLAKGEGYLTPQKGDDVTGMPSYVIVQTVNRVTALRPY